MLALTVDLNGFHDHPGRGVNLTSNNPVLCSWNGISLYLFVLISSRIPSFGFWWGFGPYFPKFNISHSKRLNLLILRGELFLCITFMLNPIYWLNITAAFRWNCRACVRAQGMPMLGGGGREGMKARDWDTERSSISTNSSNSTSGNWTVSSANKLSKVGCRVYK